MAGKSAQEKRWEAESDAHHLSEAKQIAKDPARTRAAKTAAKRLAAETQKNATSMKAVAGRAAPKPKASKRPGKKR